MLAVRCFRNSAYDLSTGSNTGNLSFAIWLYHCRVIRKASDLFDFSPEYHSVVRLSLGSGLIL